MDYDSIVRVILNDIIELIEASTLINVHSEVYKQENESNADAENDQNHNNDSLVELLDEYYEHIEIDNDNDDAQHFLADVVMATSCDACKMKESFFWRRVTRRQIVCNDCFYEKAYLILFDDEHLKKKHQSTPANPTSSLTTAEATTTTAKRIKKPPKTTANKKAEAADSNRPVTRTTLNNGGAKKQFATQLSSSSTSTTVVDDSDQKEFGLNTESNKTTTQNLRKSARISKSKKGSELEENAETTTTIAVEESKLANTSESMPINRRTKIFKKSSRPPNPIRTETTLVSKLFTSELIFHRGFYLKVGDIVALVDNKSTVVENEPNEPPPVYFAQIRAFLCNQFGEKSAVITWLIPVNGEYRQMRRLKDFDPRWFVLGPAEDSPRSLDSMEFVCRPDELAAEKGGVGNSLCSFNYLNQYRNDLLRHRFELEDLAASNFRIVTKTNSA